MKRTLVIGVVVLGLLGAAVPASSAIGGSAPVAPSSGLPQGTAEFPPGLSEEGVTDPLALVGAHRQTLENTSYALSTTYTYRRPNGTLLAQGTTAMRVAPGAASYFGATSQTTANATRPLGVGHYEVEVWANETRAVVARNLPDAEPSYRQLTRADAPMDPDTQWELLYAVFGTGETAVVGQTERNGTTLFKVVSVPSSDADSDVPRHEFSALVDSRGVVHSLQTTRRTTVDGGPAIVSRTIRVTGLGTTTVERPPWYQRAVENETG